MGTAGTIFLGIFGGGSLVTIVELIFKRIDKKKESKSGVLKEIKSIKSDITELRGDLETRLDKVERSVEDGKAIQARARILRFNDELQHGRMFSKEAWDQTFEDISYYKSHCENYVDFPNAKADASMRNIVKVHAELLAKERDGEEVFL